MFEQDKIERLTQRLGQASGALDDIAWLVTSCVPHDADEMTKALAQAVLNRILCSADRVRRKPSWYVHDYEQKEFEKYLSGETKACATDRPCIEVAAELSDVGKTSG